MAFITGLQDALDDLMMNLAMLSIVVLAIPLVSDGEMRGVYLAFLALVVLGSFEAVQPLGTAFQFLGRSVSAGERLFEIVDAEPEVKDPAEPLPLPVDHNLEFEGVGFRYEAGDRFALEDITFTLERGKRVAVVGPSGAGKSTLAGLVLRFWDPTQGEIIVGGHDIRGTPRTTCGPSSASSRRTPTSSTTPCAATCSWPGQRRQTPTCKTCWHRPDSTSSSNACPEVSTLRSASRGSGSRAASVSASP